MTETTQKPNTFFLATVNGGVWRTTNGHFSPNDQVDNDNDNATDEADESPTWTPMT